MQSDAESTAPPERTHVCTEPACGRSFVRSEHLSRHRLNHHANKVFACSRCPKRFVRPDLYQRHKARHDRGMHFRNTGGVVAAGGVVQNIISDTTVLPDTPTPQMSTSLMSRRTYQVNSTAPAFVSRSPDDPETLFFDNSTNVWDLPDSLEWFFEAPIQDNVITAISDNHPSSMPVQFPSFHDSLLPVTLTLAPDTTVVASNCWSTVQSRLIKSLFSLPPDLLQSEFFQPNNLAMCFNLYFENYHSHFPILHRPTLIAAAAEPLLIASIITLGSTLATDEAIYSLGQRIHDSLRWIIFQTGKFELPAPLWCLQALLLIQAQAKMFSTRKHHEMAHIFHGAILTMMKRGRAYSPSLEPDRNHYTTLEYSWRQWAEQESSRRTAFFAFIMDAQHSSVFGHTPVLSVSDVRLPLPCSENLWECPTAAIWQEQLQSTPKSPQFLPTLKALLAKTLVPSSCSDYSRLILLHGFLSLTTHLHAREFSTLGLGSGNGKAKDASTLPTQMDDWIEIISSALGVWSFTLLSLDSSLCLEAARPLHQMAYIILHANITDCHILAKDPALLDNLLSQKEWSRAEARLKLWSAREEAKRAVSHSLLLVKDTVLNGKRYLAREDNVAARPWCLYNAILVLWAYGQTVEAPQGSSSDATIIGAEEYLARMLSRLENKQDSAAYAQRTKGLLMSTRHVFEGCRWELLEEAYQTISRLAIATV